MADNVIITQGTGTSIAAEQISGAYLQRIKLALGVVDADNGDVSLSNPMPSIVTGGTVNIGAIPNVVVSGTVNTTSSISISSVTVTSGTINIGNATPIVISGTVNSNISIGTVAISGGTTNIGNIPTVIVSGTVSVGNNSVTLIGGTANTGWNQIAGNTISTNTGATGVGVQRVVIADNTGRTLISTSGTTNTTIINNTIIPLNASFKNKVYAFALSTLSTSQTNVIFTDGTNGSPLWQYVLQAPSGTMAGANLAVTPPAFLFANSNTNTPVLLQITGGTASPVAYSVSYWQDAT